MKIKTETVEKIVDYQLKNGLKGFYVCGNTGECSVLPASTRMEMLESIVKANGGIPVAVAVLVDRSGGKAKFEVPCVSLLEFSFPTYEPDKIPPELASIPAVHPGS